MPDPIDRHQLSTVPAGNGNQPRTRTAGQADIFLVNRKRIGDYLIEAGLLTKSQVDVALIDQQMTEMKFGEILAARGWIKQQTIEFLMTKVVLPERKTLEQRARARKVQENSEAASANGQAHGQTSGRTNARPPDQANGRMNGQADQGQSLRGLPNPSPSELSAAAQQGAAGRRDVPISKPLPPVKTNDGDVNWVG